MCIRSLLDYACNLQGMAGLSLTIGQFNDIENMLIRAFRITFGTRDLPYESALKCRRVVGQIFNQIL